MDRHRRVEGRSPVDITLGHAAELDAWTDKQEIWSRDWRTGPGERAHWKKAAAATREAARALLDEAIRVEVKIEAGTHDVEQYPKTPRPFRARAGGAPSRRAQKRGR